jgi:hypothetical protein
MRSRSGTKATRSQSRIFFEEKDEAFSQKTKTQKLKISSRMGEFTSPEAIQILPKFALGYLR